MKFSPTKHFKAYKDCKNCNGGGVIETLEGRFNVRTMDFDLVTELICADCLEQSKEDFYSYLEDQEK